MNAKKILRVIVGVLFILLFQDMLLLILAGVTGQNAVISTILHIKFILYQVVIPLSAILYGFVLLLIPRSEK